MSHHENSRRVTPVLCDVLVHPAQGLGDIANEHAHFDVRQEAVVCRDKDKAAFGKHARLDLDARLVSRLPTAAMDPEHDREVLGIIRRVDVEDLSLMGRIGVWDVGGELLRLCDGHEQKSGQYGFHRFHSGQREKAHLRTILNELRLALASIIISDTRN